jgi:TAT-translocated FGD2 family F420-dependent dehydrogenase
MAGPDLSNVDRRHLLLSAGALISVAAACSSGSEAKSDAGPPDKRPPTPLRHGMVGFTLAHEQFTVSQLVEFGTAAEAAGFDALATSDHFQPWQANEGHSGHAWVTLGALGQRTRRIWMGTSVTCPTLRHHPAMVAEAFATLSLLSPGRIFLGLGTGEALNEQAATGQWPPYAERSARLIEATQLIRELWTGNQVEHDGTYYKVHAKLYDPPASPIPILMAANGPTAMQRAGQYADGLITDAKTWREHKAEFEAAARTAGKDPGQMPIFIEQFVVVGDTQDAQQAAEFWRFQPKAWNPYWNVPDPRTILERADAEVPLEQVYGDWPISTDPAVHLKALTDLFDSGVSEVHIHSGQPDQKRVIEFYGKQVLPSLRRD